MPWGAHFHTLLPLRVAAAASMLFWLGLIAFVALGFAFDADTAPSRWWLEPLDDALIFTVWTAASVATAACIWAMRAEWHRTRKRVESMRKRDVASSGEGGQCSAL